jgi:hypothetical protein
MKARSFFTALGAVVVLLLLLGAGSFYWLFGQNPLSLLQAGTVSSPKAAMFVPKSAPIVTSLLVNPDRLAAFRQVMSRPQERRQRRDEIAQLWQSLLANTGLEYERDVQPWLGEEITLAVTTVDRDRDPGNGRQPGYLLVLESKNPSQSREFLQLFWQQRAIAGTELVFEQYKGVKLISGTPGAASAATPLPLATVATAAIGDEFILFASHPKVLRDAINNVQAADLSLDEAPVYARSLEVLTNPRIGMAFVNLPELTDWLSAALTVKQPNQDAAVLALPDPGRTLAVALELDRQGLLAATAVPILGETPEDSTAEETPQAPLTEPVSALQYIPASSPIAFAGTGLNQVWQTLSNEISGNDAVSQLIRQALTNLQTRWQIDLADAVFPWVQGEYALAMLPVEGDRRSALPTASLANDWIFVAEIVEQFADSARSQIEHLDDQVRQQGFSVGKLDLGSQPILAWTRLTAGNAATNPTSPLQAEVLGAHTTIGNYEIFASSIAAMNAALDAVENSLRENPDFQAAIAPLQQPNYGYVYLDWAASQSTLERQFPWLKVVELAGKPLLQHLRSVTVSSYGHHSGMQQGGIFLKLS